LTAAVLLAPAIGEAARPLDTEDTEVLDPGAAEFETGLDLALHDDASAFGGRLVLSVGVLPRLEARVETSVVGLDTRGEAVRGGPGDSLLGAKYRLLDEAPHQPALLLATAVRLPTGDADRGLGTGEGAVLGLLGISRSWGALTLTANAVYEWSLAGRSGDTVVAALAGEHQLGRGWTLVGELVTILGLADRPHRFVARLGATWQLREYLRLDGAIAAGRERSSEDLIVTLGATFGF
jgi:hypothetical protein